ncbi:MAG: magnesium transporter CorA [Acidobacteria bacterium RIFCSPLOWO2_02_FULL_61_28]|nr:MAG: magnesium transporter CorA [Acidobacteria bacterium RIFCSPLOWO2_02_FULL_61_28]
MEWHDLRDPNDPELDRLAERHRLHSLHIEDCRHRGQNAKIEEEENYLFAVLKPVEINPDGSLEFSDLDLFLGRDFLITVQESECRPARQALEKLRANAAQQRPDILFYKIADAIVDSYLPVLDQQDETCDALQDEVLERPSPAALDRIFSAKRNLIELRRVLANTRDVMSHLQRTRSDLIAQDLWPFLRDVYDHVARALDTVEVQRDILSGALEIYLSSVSQRTNQVVKVLTVLGTITLPALLVTSFYGMNLRGLPWGDAPQGAWLAVGVMFLATAALLVLLRIFRWL